MYISASKYNIDVLARNTHTLSSLLFENLFRIGGAEMSFAHVTKIIFWVFSGLRILPQPSIKYCSHQIEYKYRQE